MERIILAAMFLLMSSNAYAQLPPIVDEDFVKVMVPVGKTRQTGAFDTIWRLDSWVFNSSEQRITISHGRPVCPIMCAGGRPSVPPRRLDPLELIPNVGSITPNGFFVYFPRAHEKDLTFHVRMVLETQDGDVPSVEVPIVHERDFRTAPIVLIEVPNSAERRVMLRVYESTGGPRTVARIRVFASSGIEILSERVVSLSRGTVGGDEFPMYSGVAQMPLSDLIDLSTAPEQLRIEVTGESPEDLPIWAFASITENDTQHVTLITPQ